MPRFGKTIHYKLDKIGETVTGTVKYLGKNLTLYVTDMEIQ